MSGGGGERKLALTDKLYLHKAISERVCVSVWVRTSSSHPPAFYLFIFFLVFFL